MAVRKVFIVGVGTGGAGSLSLTAKKKVRQADILYGGKRLLEMFPKHPGQKIIISKNLAQITDIIKNSRDQKRVIVLASGDPGLFGIADYLGTALGKSAIKILPNVSAMQSAFARIKESWEDAVLVSAHARPIENVITQVRNSKKAGIFTDAKNTPGVIAQALLAQGLNSYHAYVCENLGEKGERITKCSIKSLCRKKFSPLNTLILLQKNSKSDKGTDNYKLGIPDKAFHRRRGQAGLITKQEIRAISLAKMQISEDSIVWDIGAGSGAVSIEAARLAANGQVYAIEKNEDDITVIVKNIHKFKALNVKAIHASAPEGLDELPAPAAVFIGGSGGKIEAIIKAVMSRLKANGRIVINIVGLENLNTALNSLRKRGLKLEITLVNIARSADIREMTRLAALNLVFIISAGNSRNHVKQ